MTHKNSIKEDTIMFTYPRLLRRVQAVLIDSILIPIAFMLTLLLVGQFEVESIYIKAAALFLPIFILEPVMVAISGGTIGHHMLGIQVQSSNSGKNLNILLALLRFVIKTFLGWLSLIFVLITKRHQAIHDLLSMSVVINKSDNLPSAEALPERSNQEDGYKYPPRFLRLFMIVLYILLNEKKKYPYLYTGLNF